MKKPTILLRIILFGLLWMFLPGSILYAQLQTISGQVVDENQQPLQGVSITVKNSKLGTMTNKQGQFELKSAPKKGALVASMVGYFPMEIAIHNKSTPYAIAMQSKATDMEDVVVVGYGSQKKINLTGSVSTVTSEDIADRPVTNLSSALAGLATGVYVGQASGGSPTDDEASIQIRGLGTLSNTAPLYLIDNVIVDNLSSINPQDVESVTFLKDAASTAIYGTLGGNGVVLVTTKKGKVGRPVVTYSGIFSRTNPSGLSNIQGVSNSVRYFQLINESYRNLGLPDRYDSSTVIQSYIEAAKNPNGLTKSGVPNYVAYPNTNWAEATINSRILQNHNVNVSGRTDNFNFLISLGHLYNPGLMDNTWNKKYQYRVNLEAKVNDMITVGTQTFGFYNTIGVADYGGFIRRLRQTAPTSYPYYNGWFGSDAVHNNAGNLFAQLNTQKGTIENTNFNTNWYAKVKLLKGLDFESKMNYSVNFGENNTYSNPKNLVLMNFQNSDTLVNNNNEYGDPGKLAAKNNFSKNWTLSMESLLRYNATFNKAHHLNLLAGYNQRKAYGYVTGISVTGILAPTAPAISSALVFNPSSGGVRTGGNSNYGIRSWFGRLNYDYKSRYLLEANLRRDASSKFGPEYRVGYFPSFSAGWNIGREAFAAGLVKKYNIKELKLRYSNGRVGNAMGDDYAWQSVYDPLNYSFNGLMATGLWGSTIGNPLLHWETVNASNIGIDLAAFKGFNFTAEWFTKRTIGILYQPTISPTVGWARPPILNLAEVRNSGLEFSAGWNSKIGKLDYSVRGNYTYFTVNNVDKYNGKLSYTSGTNLVDGTPSFFSNINAVATGTNNKVLEGHMINEHYLLTLYRGSGSYSINGKVDPRGGPKDGMIRTPADMKWLEDMVKLGYHFAPVSAVATLPGGNPPNLNYGDLIYADNNNDGVFGGDGDRQLMNSSTAPKYVYGFNFRLGYKGINLSAVFAGAGGMKYFYQYGFAYSSNLTPGSAVPQMVADDHYYYNPADPGKSNINGYFPRLKTVANNAEYQNSAFSDFWLYDASYMKLKNIQIGYDFPASFVQRYTGKALTKFNVYFSAENVLTFTKYPGLDPEMKNGIGYPILRNYALGINVNF